MTITAPGFGSAVGTDNKQSTFGWHRLCRRGATWLGRSPREWLWVIRRRLFPHHPYRFTFDDDLSIQVRLQDELGLDYALGREFEPDVCAFFRRFVRPGMVVFDLGANIGQFTLLAAKRIGPSGSVHAFEPCPDEYGQLCDNIRLNDFRQVRTVQKAICDHVGEVVLNTCEDGLGLYNSLGQPFRQGNIRACTVQAVTLDEYVRSASIDKVDLVKMDIEGAELAALRGGAALFSRPDAPTIICEFSDPAASGMGHSTKDLRQELERFGYSLFRYNLVTDQMESEPDRERYDYANLICSKRDALISGLAGFGKEGNR